MYKRTTINESVQPRFLDIEEFMTYTSLGRTSAMRLGSDGDIEQIWDCKIS